MRSTTIVISFILCSSVGCRAFAQQWWTPVALVPTPGDLLCVPLEINDSGVAVGRVKTASGAHRAAVFGPSGTLLLPPGASDDAALDIDRNGTVLARVGGLPYLWTPGGGLQPIAGGSMNPVKMNELGVVCGDDVAGGWCRWDAVNGLQLLGGYGEVAHARDINDAGVIVGWGYVSATTQPAVRYVPGQGFTEFAFSNPGAAHAINESNLSVGYVWDAFAQNEKPVVWSGTSVLYSEHGDGPSLALNDIDAHGRCVGGQLPAFFGAPTTAALYVKGQVSALAAHVAPGSGWTFSSAACINDAGQIVGLGKLNGVETGFRLDPPARVHAVGGQLGGPLAFVHDAPNYPSRIALTGVSATGKATQWMLDGHALHLDVDALTLSLLAQSALSSAVLDGSGHGQTVALQLPNDPGLAGAPLWIASAIFDLAQGKVVATGSTVKIALK